MVETFQRPGWYPDPDGKGERWWNGTSWSESRRDGAAAFVPAANPTIYSADNPAPQRPDPYGQPLTLAGGVDAPRAAFTIDARANRHAMIGFVSGIISMFFNFIPIVGVIAIVFSTLGITRANALKAQGAKTTLMPFAVIGLGLGVVSTLIALFSIVMFALSISVSQ